MTQCFALGLVGGDGVALRLAAAARAAGLGVVAAEPGAAGTALAGAGAVLVDGGAGFFGALDHPRLVVVRAAPGEGVEALLERLYVHLEPGDLLVEASESYWGDSLRRHRRMRHRSLFFLDLAVLPGDGAPRLLLAGEPRGLERALPPLRRLAGPCGPIVAGPAGAAHFARLVRRGLALAGPGAAAEAIALLRAFPGIADPDSLLADLAPEEAAPPPGLPWLVEDARRLGVRAPLLVRAIARLAHDPPPGARITPFLAPGEEP